MVALDQKHVRRSAKHLQKIQNTLVQKLLGLKKLCFWSLVHHQVRPYINNGFPKFILRFVLDLVHDKYDRNHQWNDYLNKPDTTVAKITVHLILEICFHLGDEHYLAEPPIWQSYYWSEAHEAYSRELEFTKIAYFNRLVPPIPSNCSYKRYNQHFSITDMESKKARGSQFRCVASIRNIVNPLSSDAPSIVWVL